VTMKFGGESMIVGPRGRIYASLETEAAPRPEPKPEAKPVAEPAGASTTAAASNGGASNGGTAPATTGTTATAAAPAADGAKKPEPTKVAPGVMVTAAEGYCVARIDLDEVRKYREEFQTLQARQPTVYKAVVRKY
jgi:predicted amidohydrolase